MSLSPPRPLAEDGAAGTFWPLGLLQSETASKEYLGELHGFLQQNPPPLEIPTIICDAAPLNSIF